MLGRGGVVNGAEEVSNLVSADALELTLALAEIVIAHAINDHRLKLPGKATIRQQDVAGAAKLGVAGGSGLGGLLISHRLKVKEGVL
jgi:hypothetical protein